MINNQKIKKHLNEQLRKKIINENQHLMPPGIPLPAGIKNPSWIPQPIEIRPQDIRPGPDDSGQVPTVYDGRSPVHWGPKTRPPGVNRPGSGMSLSTTRPTGVRPSLPQIQPAWKEILNNYEGDPTILQGYNPWGDSI